jgi:hypothetical protein
MVELLLFWDLFSLDLNGITARSKRCNFLKDAVFFMSGISTVLVTFCTPQEEIANAVNTTGI